MVRVFMLLLAALLFDWSAATAQAQFLLPGRQRAFNQGVRQGAAAQAAFDRGAAAQAAFDRGAFFVPQRAFVPGYNVGAAFRFQASAAFYAPPAAAFRFQAPAAAFYAPPAAAAFYAPAPAVQFVPAPAVYAQPCGGAAGFFAAPAPAPVYGGCGAALGLRY